MKHLFVPYEIARQLKDKGFDEECLAGWHKQKGEMVLMSTHIQNPLTLANWHSLENTLAPLYQQVMDFFREKHGIQININWNKFYPNSPYEWTIRPTWRDQVLQPMGTSGMMTTYYDALNRAIEEALKLI
jgi:hypothetical protein